MTNNGGSKGPRPVGWPTSPKRVSYARTDCGQEGLGKRWTIDDFYKVDVGELGTIYYIKQNIKKGVVPLICEEFINKRKEVAYKLLSNEEIKTVKSEKDIKLIIDNNDGKIYEYNNFKEYKESLGIQH